MSEKVEKTEQEWKAELTPEQYRVLREKATERAFTGRYHATKDPGTYRCAGCGAELFTSDTKYDSGTGWPSFFQPVADENVATKPDRSHGMLRVEIACPRCDAHLGHVFPDGPHPTGVRFCINSCALELDPSEPSSG